MEHAIPLCAMLFCAVYVPRKMSFKNARQLKTTRNKQDVPNEKLNRNYKY